MERTGILLPISLFSSILLIPFTVFAYNELSIRSEGSFTLFENDYDYMQDPSRLPHFLETSIYTTLTNRGGSSSLQGGFSGNTLFGGLGLLFDVSLSGSETENTLETINPDPETETDILSTRTSFSRIHDFSLFGAYGREFSDTLSMGGGLIYEEGVNLSSLGYSTTLGTFTKNGENFTEEDLLLGIVERFTGSLNEGNRRMGGLISLLFKPGRNLEIEGDLYYSYVRSLYRIEAEYSLESGGTSISGSMNGVYPNIYPSVNSFSNYRGSHLRLDLEPLLRINDRIDCKFTFRQEYIFTTFADDSYSGVVTSLYDLYPLLLMAQESRDVMLSGSPYDGNRTYGLFQLNYNPSKRFDVRGGLGFDYLFYTLDVTVEEENINSINGSIIERVEEGDRYYGFTQSLYILIPVSLELRTTRRTTIRVGSRYNLLISKRSELLEDVYFRDSSAAGEYFEEEKSGGTFRSTASSIDYALGVAYHLKKYFTLEALFTGNATVGETIDFGNSIGIGTLLLSGTIIF